MTYSIAFSMYIISVLPLSSEMTPCKIRRCRINFKMVVQYPGAHLTSSYLNAENVVKQNHNQVIVYFNGERQYRHSLNVVRIFNHKYIMGIIKSIF
jgi:hypothetical protein